MPWYFETQGPPQGQEKNWGWGWGRVLSRLLSLVSTFCPSPAKYTVHEYSDSRGSRARGSNRHFGNFPAMHHQSIPIENSDHDVTGRRQHRHAHRHHQVAWDDESLMIMDRGWRGRSGDRGAAHSPHKWLKRTARTSGGGPGGSSKRAFNLLVKQSVRWPQKE